MALTEAISILATIKGVDLVSGVLDRVSGSFGKMAEESQMAASAAEEAAARIDASLLTTASGENAVTIASAQAQAAQERLAVVTQEQADAEQILIARMEQANAVDGDNALAMERLTAASENLAVAQRNTAKAAADASAAEARLAATVDAASGANLVAARESEAAATAQGAAAVRSGEANAAAMSKAKTAAFGAAAVIAGIGYESVKAAMNFQTLTQRLVTTAGESQSALGYIRTGIMQVAQQTGTSANDLAKSMYTVEAAGYDAAHGGLDVLRAATQGAQLEGSDFGTVANAVTDILKDYHLSASQSANVTSQLVAAVANGKANFQSMSAAMSNVLPMASVMHIKFNDVAGVLAEMTSHGVTAQRASQNLANAMQSFEKPSGSMLKEFKAVGISTQDLQNSLASRGLGGTLQWLSQIAAADAPKLGQTYAGALGKLVGTSAALRVALMTTGDNAKDTAKAIGNIGKASADAQGNVKGFGQVQQTAGYQFNALKSSLVNTGIAIGTALLPALTSMAKAINGVVAPIMAWVQQHQTLVKHLFEGVAAILAVVGAVKLVTTVVEIFEGVMMLLAANPWVAAITALVLIVIYCYTHFKTFRDIVNTVMKVVGETIKATITVLVAVFKWLVQAAEAMWHGMVAAWNALVGAAKDVGSFLAGIWNAIASVTTTVWNAISGFFEKWWPLLLVIFATPIAVIMGLWNHTHEAIFSTAKTVWNAISSFFVGVWHLITSVTQTSWNLFKTYIINPIMAVWAFMQPGLHQIESLISGVWNFIVGATQAAWGLVKTWIIKPVQDCWNFLTGWIGRFIDIGSGIINGIWNGLSAGWNWLTNQVSNLANNLLSAAKHAIGIGSPSKAFADEFGKWIPHGIAMGINQHAGVAKDAITNLAKGLTTQANATLSSKLTVGGGFGVAGGPLGGAGAQPNVSIHFDLREAKIMNDRDVDILIQKIEKRLVPITLPSGGYKARF